MTDNSSFGPTECLIIGYNEKPVLISHLLCLVACFLCNSFYTLYLARNIIWTVSISESSYEIRAFLNERNLRTLEKEKNGQIIIRQVHHSICLVYLRVIDSEDTKWNHHIASVTMKIGLTLGLFQYIFREV